MNGKNVQGHKRGWSESASENGELVALCESLEERRREFFYPYTKQSKSSDKKKIGFLSSADNV